MSATYPTDRQRCGFAIRYLKWLYESGSVNDIGPDAAAIVAAVVLQEDATHYTKAPTFWNPQLMMRCGFRNEKTFIRARDRAVKAGLLHYAKGSKTQPAAYFVAGLAVDITVNTTTSTVDSTGNRGRIGEESGNILTPTPTHKNKSARTPEKSTKTFQRPTLEEVRAYAASAGLTIDARQWIDHYQANGWRVGRNPMRDWRAAVRQWARRQRDYQGVTPSANGHATTGRRKI